MQSLPLSSCSMQHDADTAAHYSVVPGTHRIFTNDMVKAFSGRRSLVLLSRGRSLQNDEGNRSQVTNKSR